jgi:hypothetical protein
MAAGVEHGKHDDGIIPHNEENTIRKAPGQNPSHFRATTQPQMNEWIFNRAPDGCANLKREFQTQAGFPIFIQIAAAARSCSASGRTMSRRLMP